MTTEQHLARLENELREIKAMMRILVPSYADDRKQAEMILGWRRNIDGTKEKMLPRKKKGGGALCQEGTELPARK